VLAIDVASYSRGSAYSFYADIANNNLTKIDKYVVTHYSYYLEDAISTLCETILIRELYLPAPQNLSEERIYRGLLKFSSEANLKINTYFNEDRIEFGNSDIIPLCNYSLGASKKNMFTVIRKDKVYTYLSGDILDGETKNMASEIIAGSHTIILGRHKTENFNFEFSKIFNNLDEIISSEENISIDKETLKFYFENGTKITFPKNKHLLYVE
jgi:hypothetical protein